MQGFNRIFAAAVLLVLLASVFQASSGCHDDSTGCCMVCNGSCACGNGCIICTTKCLMGSGCACNSTIPAAAPGHAIPPSALMSESPDAQE